jgi:hypothetical protein
LILADGVVVGVAYSSELKARRKAFLYAYECEYQDEPYFPKMTVKREEIDPE